MENLDKETIKNLTELCRIDCTEEEKESLLQDLKKILNFISQLEEVDTENVVPCSHVLSEMANVSRDDRVSEMMPRETFLKNAPSHTGGMIKVPSILK
ncbi:MAG TPA: Asp-tRNA(Asn)/Glu-tRNA(Gln) amidotransferase subunit GatC [Parachlamydiaceae bacterium]|nr:Asp-tRNA(Asn)/Glu-tRNA(Gln) amidotransferase subunit GatC [Parachlamydiaceae bacterium]